MRRRGKGRWRCAKVLVEKDVRRIDINKTKQNKVVIKGKSVYFKTK